jgi:hypothetical protein
MFSCFVWNDLFIFFAIAKNLSKVFEGKTSKQLLSYAKYEEKFVS